MINGLFESGSLPVLERVIQFTTVRHEILSNNNSNLSTPYFRPADLDPRSFQKALSRAIENRREQKNAMSAPLELEDTDQLSFKKHSIQVKPVETNANILFHDQNNRDLEKQMQHLAENTQAHNTAIEMLKSRYDIMQAAIRERV